MVTQNNYNANQVGWPYEGFRQARDIHKFLDEISVRQCSLRFMPHLSPLYWSLTGFVCGFRFWVNFLAVMQFWMIFSFILRILINPNAPLFVIVIFYYYDLVSLILYCVVSENIHTPTTEGIEGVGGSRTQEIPEGREGWLIDLVSRCPSIQYGFKNPFLPTK